MTDDDGRSDARTRARDLLQRAMALHAGGEIDEALALAEEATRLDPGYGDAWTYLGNTLVTRKRRFADGLRVLDRAVEEAPRDPAVLYTAGWCREFVANALERPKRGGQAVEESADELYERAREVLLRALELDPDDQMRGDIEDILDVISNATGVPWDEGWYERAAPRPR